ncbi:hypothetical protein DRQ33_08770, partial [bacterium]
MSISRGIAVSLIFLPLILFSADISGIILDKNSGEPIPAANVIIEKANIGASSDLDGRFRLQGVPTGNWDIIVTVLGYEKITHLIKIVKDDEEIELEFKLEARALIGDLITVTAIRNERILKDVPIRTEIVTLEDIKQKGATNIFDALQNEPGIRVEKQCSNCNFTLVRVSGLGAGYSQILIDGQPTFSGLASVYGLQQLQTGNVERIEIVKGAGSALYGSDATGGVINIITKEPSPVPKMNFGMSIGEHNTNNFYFSGTIHSGRISSSYYAQKDMKGAIDQTGAETSPYTDSGPDGFTDRVESDNLGTELKIRVFEPIGKGSKIIAFGRYLHEFRRGGNFQTWENPFDIDSEHIRTNRSEIGLKVKKDFSQDNRIEFNLNYVNHYRNATNGAAWDKAIDAGMLDENLDLTEIGQQFIDSLGMAQFESEWFPRPFIVEENLYLADLSYVHPIGTREIMFGAQYRKSKLEQNINNARSNKKADDFGIFTQIDLFTSSRILELVLGARYDMHWSEDELTGGKYKTEVVNPRVAIKYLANEKLTFRGTAGTGFRVPYLFSEDLHLCASAPRIYKGPDLKPERAFSTSISIDYNLKFHQFGINVFNTQIDDKIEFISADEEEIPHGFDYKWTNAGDVNTRGMELFGRGFLLEKLVEYNIGLVYNIAKFDELRFTEENYPGNDDGWENSDWVPRSPALTVNGKMVFSPGEWTLALNANFTGAMFIDHMHDEDIDKLRIEKTEPYIILDGRISRKIFNNAEIFLNVDNILNYTQPKRDITDA